MKSKLAAACGATLAAIGIGAMVAGSVANSPRRQDIRGAGVGSQIYRKDSADPCYWNPPCPKGSDDAVCYQCEVTGSTLLDTTGTGYTSKDNVDCGIMSLGSCQPAFPGSTTLKCVISDPNYCACPISKITVPQPKTPPSG